MAGDFAPEQLVVKLYRCCLVCGDFHCLSGGNLIPSCQVAFLLGDGVLAGGQVLDVDFPGAVGSIGLAVALALHQEREALQDTVLAGLADEQASLGVDHDSLGLVVDVGVGDYFYAILIQRFKDYDCGTRQIRGVQGVGQLHGAICGFGSELRFSGDFRTVHQQRVAGALVHKNA